MDHLGQNAKIRLAFLLSRKGAIFYGLVTLNWAERDSSSRALEMQ